jgi:hypothetical protein
MSNSLQKTKWNFVLVILSALLAWSPISAEEEEPSETQVNPWDIAGWNIATSLYTKHFDPDPDHVNNQKLIGLEAVFENDWLAGIAVFDNSFGQNTQFMYVGKTWPIMRSEYWYVKLMGGLLHGYKEPYEDKIPLNELGIAPAILPALGFRYKRVMVEANLAGIAALTITAGFRF